MADKPLTPGRSYWIKQTTRTVPGRIAELRYGIDVNTLAKRPALQLAMNEVGHVALTVDQPIVHDAYATHPATGAFIVIDRLTNNTVGAGMILPHADRRAGDDLWAATSQAPGREPSKSLVSVTEREARLGQRGATVLLFGPDSPARATLAHALERRLFDAGVAVTVLNGPDLRRGLSRDLDYTGDDHAESLRRAAEVARLLNDTGLLCICAFVAPWEVGRETAQQIVGADRFLSVALTTGGKQPARADLVLAPDSTSLEENLDRIVALLSRRGLIG